MPVNVNGIACTLAGGVRETTQTVGTGSYSLDGAATVDGVTYRTFVAGVGDGVTTVYTARLGSQFETAIGVVAAGSPATLTRSTILESSNSGNAVSWSAGVKDIFCDLAAAVAHSLQSQITTVNNRMVAFNQVSLVGLASAGITGLPANALEIILTMRGWSFPSNDSALVQLGTSGGYVTTGYASNSVGIEEDNTTAVLASTAGFVVRGGIDGQVIHGIMHIVRQPGSNFWVESHTGRQTSGTRVVTGGGTISLASIDRIRVARNEDELFSTGDFGVLVRV